MIAAIMCGGRASRMSTAMEKSLLKVDGIVMIERVASALARTHRFGRVVAAVSANTPLTNAFLKTKDIEMIETAGDGYPQDLSRLLSMLRPEKVMVFPADLPLLDTRIVNDIIDAVSCKQEPAVSIVLEKAFVEGIGVKPSVVFGRYCHSGITVFDAANIAGEIVPESFVVMNRKEIALNVNTKEELELAELLVQRA